MEFEQAGSTKAEYGSELLKRLSRDLTDIYGKGFSRSNLVYMRKLFLTYPKSQTLSDFLSWSQYSELLKLPSPRRYCCQSLRTNLRMLLPTKRKS